MNDKENSDSKETEKCIKINIRYNSWIRLNEDCSTGYLHTQMDLKKADKIINDILDDLEELRDEDET